MKHTTPITVEHVVVESKHPFEKVVGALEARLRPVQDWTTIGQQAATTHASWEQYKRRLKRILDQAG